MNPFLTHVGHMALDKALDKAIEVTELSFGAWILHKITSFSKKISLPPAVAPLLKKIKLIPRGTKVETLGFSKKTNFSNLTSIRMGMVGAFKKTSQKRSRLHFAPMSSIVTTNFNHVIQAALSKKLYDCGFEGSIV